MIPGQYFQKNPATDYSGKEGVQTDASTIPATQTGAYALIHLICSFIHYVPVLPIRCMNSGGRYRMSGPGVVGP